MIYLNFSIDDIHPETSKEISDCGGDRSKGQFKYIDKLLESYPKIKFTFFVTPNWTDKPNHILSPLLRRLKLPYTNSWKGEPFRLDKHLDWCRWLNKYKQEVGIHGFTHHISSRLHSAEFKDMSYKKIEEKIRNAEKLFKKSKLKYIKCFSTPGWEFNQNLLDCLDNNGYRFITLNINYFPYPKSKNQIFYVNKNLIGIPLTFGIDNANPFVVSNNSFVCIRAHINNNYGYDHHSNGFNKKNYDNICSFIDYLKENDRIVFSSLSLISKKFKPIPL